MQQATEGTKTILSIVGTRPEAIKMAPVIKALQAEPWCRCRVVVTAQHRQMLDQMLDFFQIVPDVDLNAMRPSQTLADLTARMLVALDEVLGRETPDLVLAQGDTTTVLAAALASFYRRIPLGHVEAGLRTHRLDAPFPEEANRVLAGRLAQVHFAPTQTAREHLLGEGIADQAIHVTGNTVIDALFLAERRRQPIGVALDPCRRLLLVTAHRRDSCGAPLRRICRAVAELSRRHEDVEVLWPVHPNPAIADVVHAELAGLARVHLCDPLAYGSFVTALARAHLVLTDSGGVTEEAPALGKPVLILRDATERPETLEAGVAQLVGTDEAAIIAATARLLEDTDAYRAMSRGASPYGDGHAAGRIVAVLRRLFAQTPAQTLRAA